MNNCFVIMPIKNNETEFLWEQVYSPVIEKSGYSPDRADKNADGRPVLEQIIESISYTPLIIADLTLSRPNCYLEVGYAMGIGKYDNLILCCREDHYSRSPNYKPTGYSVHFDLQSFDIIWWHEKKLENFREELSVKIVERKKLIGSIDTPEEKAITGKKVLEINKIFESFISKKRQEIINWKRRT